MTHDVMALAAPGVRGLQPYQPGKPIEELQREYGVSSVIKLASNESPLGPSPRALAAAREALVQVMRYPDGGAYTLKARLAEKDGVAPEQITVGNGSNDVLELMARAFVTPEHEVMFSAHAFAVYPIVTQAVGAKAVVVPARDWGHDLEAMARAVTPRTRLVFIANPNNPTGTWLRAAELEGFIAQLPRDVLVVVDEAYFEYVGEPDYPNAINWVERYPHLVVTRTFSKAYGLAGLRVGYGVSSRAIAEVLNRVRQPFNVNGVGLAAAAAALEDPSHIRRSAALNADGLSQLTRGFGELGLRYIPSVANFVSVDLGRPAAPVYEALLRQGIIVRPVANYGMPGHLRITVGLPQENTRFLEVLKRVLRTEC